MLFQSIQDRRCIAIFITGVKREVDDGLLSIADIVSMIPGEIIRSGIAHGSPAFLLKTQSPAAVRRYRERFDRGNIRYRMGEMGKEGTGKKSKDEKKRRSQKTRKRDSLLTEIMTQGGSKITQIRHIDT